MSLVEVSLVGRASQERRASWERRVILEQMLKCPDLQVILVREFQVIQVIRADQDILAPVFLAILVLAVQAFPAILALERQAIQEYLA